jgi:hypothetical protein
MQQRSVIERIEILERKVEVLESLPERVTAVELQLVQLREEMRAEFSATRAEVRAGDEETRRTLRDEIRAGDEETRRTLRDAICAGDEETRRTLRDEIRAGDEETRRTLRDEIRASDEETRRTLRDEIRASDEETRRYMRMLHEDVIARISVLHERPPRPRKKRDPEH